MARLGLEPRTPDFQSDILPVKLPRLEPAPEVANPPNLLGVQPTVLRILN